MLTRLNAEGCSPYIVADAGRIWTGLVAMSQTFEECWREWFLPTYLSQLLSYPGPRSSTPLQKERQQRQARTEGTIRGEATRAEGHVTVGFVRFVISTQIDSGEPPAVPSYSDLGNIASHKAIPLGLQE